jgi:tetratricopeptide (TPR) repeat protein
MNSDILMAYRAKTSFLIKKLACAAHWFYQQRVLLNGHPLTTLTILRGFRSLGNEKLGQARCMFEQALHMHATDYRAFIGLAKLSTREGNLEEGLDYWKEAIKFLPSGLEAQDAIFDPEVGLADCLFAMYKFCEAREILLERINLRPDDQNALFMLARVYLREGKFDESLALWRKLKVLFPQGFEPVMGIVSHFIDTNQLSCAESEINNAIEKWPDRIELKLQSARVAYKRAEYEISRSLLLTLLSNRPEHVPACALLQKTLKILGRSPELTGFIAGLPESVRESEQFIAEVLVPHYLDIHDLDSYRLCVEKLIEAPLTARGSHVVGRYFLRNHEYERASVAAETAIAKFPYYLHNYRVLLKAYQQTNRSERMESLKILMKKRFGEAEVYPLFIELGARFINDDMPLIFDWVVKNPTVRSTHFSDLLDCILQSEKPDITTEMLSKKLDLTPRESVRLQGIHCQMRDMDLIAKSATTDVAWEEFELNLTQYSSGLAEAASLLFSSETRAQSLHDFYDSYLDAIRQYKRANIYSRESYYDAVMSIEDLLIKIRDKTPTSLVRLGDGEGNFLPYHETMLKYAALDRCKIQHVWWGETLIKGHKLAEIESTFLRVIDNADILGIPPPWRVLKENMLIENVNPAEQYSRGNAAIVDLLQSGAISKDKNLVSSAVSNDWHSWDIYQAILKMVDTVSCISCHDLSEFLQTQYGVMVRQAFILPAEHAYREMFSIRAADNSVEKERNETRIFPELFESISEAIKPQKGEVYLIGAGFLGKIFCDLVKRRGGIGIDIGSTADYWMGHETRRYKNIKINFNPVRSGINDMPFDNIITDFK